MKKLFTILISCISIITLNANSLNLNGRVLDHNSNEAIQFATVIITSADSSLLRGCITDSDGVFNFDGIPEGKYSLMASFLGYRSYSTELHMDQNHTTPDITMQQDENMIGDIIVEARRPYVQHKLDRYVVNISDHLLTSGRNGLDILRHTPGLLVRNDNVTIMGENVEVWIDGRPSRMDGSTLAAYLNSMQGENIDQIEVITTPSSRFDAGGGKPIINIKTKKNRGQEVFNGSANAGYELSKTNFGLGGINLNYRKDKVNIFGSYNVRGGKDMMETEQTTINKSSAADRTYYSKGETDNYHSLSHNYRAGIDIYANEKNLIGFLVNGFNTDQAARSNTLTEISPALNNTSFSEMNSKYKPKTSGQMYNANYSRKFNKEGMALNADVDYGRISNTQEQWMDYTFKDTQLVESEPSTSERSHLPQTIEMWSAKIDFENEIGGTMYWDAGIKASGVKTDNDITYENLVGNNWIKDPGQSNHFKYNETIFAAYVNFRQMRQKWGYQVGIRAEYTDTEGNQVTTGDVNKNDYMKIFPSAFLQYAPSQNHIWGLSYSSGIRRPGYQTLNPFQIARDNYSYIAGNPDLDPGYRNNLELKYIYRQKLSLSITWTHNDKMVTLCPVIDADGERYGYVYENFGKRNAYVFQVNYDKTFFDKVWKLSLMGQAAYITNKSHDSSVEFDNDGFSGALWIGNSFQINKTLWAEANLLYMPFMRMGFSKSDKAYNNLSLGLGKNVLKEKGTIRIAVSDLLKGEKNTDITDLNNIYTKANDYYNSRKITFNVSYKFGSGKVKGARSRSIGIEDELGRSTEK